MGTCFPVLCLPTQLSLTQCYPLDMKTIKKKALVACENRLDSLSAGAAVFYLQCCNVIHVDSYRLASIGVCTVI